MGLYSVALRATHAFLSLIVSMLTCWTSLKSRIDFNNSTKSVMESSFMQQALAGDSMVASDIINTSMKIPSHLGLLLFEDDISMAALATLMALAYSAGVRNISCYARQGVAEFDTVALEKMIRKSITTSSNKLRDISIYFRHMISPPSDCGVGDKNALSVYFVRPEHGRGAIVQTAKDLAKSLNNKTITTADITPDYIDAHLKGMTSANCPDPEMVIRFGGISSLCGYLPWQMRLAEIISFPTLNGFNAKTFKRAMNIYNKTEQRFGK